MRSEIRLKCVNNEYIDSLIISLVRQGYEVYLRSEDNEVCFLIDNEEITPI
jgi:hypothetical protein